MANKLNVNLYWKHESYKEGSEMLKRLNSSQVLILVETTDGIHDDAIMNRQLCFLRGIST